MRFLFFETFKFPEAVVLAEVTADMIRELETHGYQVSPGTLYPILHGLEDRGYLRANSEVVNGKVRKLYTATDLGRQALSEGVVKAEELLRELRE